MDDDSDTSSLSSAPPDEEVQRLAPIFTLAKKAKIQIPKQSPARPSRPSPPHEDTFADNQDIAFIVMFRSRFSAAFPAKVPHLGPQDIERAICDDVPGPQAEAMLCALLGLVLNRKKPVEQGHHGRALDEAISTHRSQWPLKWEGKNPLSGSRGFETMTPSERLYLLRTLIMWSLTSSEEISAIIKNNYKQNRHNDDENQPLSVQPWGRDYDKRRYYLVEGQDDTSFRVYREGARYAKDVKWYNMAGEIEEVRTLAERLDKDDGSQAARTLAQRMLNAIPRFEATEEKRKRREYRQIRRAQFTRPEPGFSMYEGRTRGKRMRYTYDDDDAFLSDTTSARRSERQSERSTPFESGPVTTLSGRQVKPRRGGEYGASLLSGQATSAEDPTTSFDELNGFDDDEDVGRPTRNAGRRSLGQINGQRKRRLDSDDGSLSDEEDAAPSGDEWDSEANEKEDYDMPDADDEQDDDEEEDEEQQTLVVKLKVSPSSKRTTETFVAGLADGAPPQATLEQPSKHETNGITSLPQPAITPVADRSGGNIAPAASVQQKVEEDQKPTATQINGENKSEITLAEAPTNEQAEHDHSIADSGYDTASNAQSSSTRPQPSDQLLANGSFRPVVA